MSPELVISSSKNRFNLYHTPRLNPKKSLRANLTPLSAPTKTPSPKGQRVEIGQFNSCNYSSRTFIAFQLRTISAHCFCTQSKLYAWGIKRQIAGLWRPRSNSVKGRKLDSQNHTGRVYRAINIYCIVHSGKSSIGNIQCSSGANKNYLFCLASDTKQGKQFVLTELILICKTISFHVILANERSLAYKRIICLYILFPYLLHFQGALNTLEFIQETSLSQLLKLRN